MISQITMNAAIVLTPSMRSRPGNHRERLLEDGLEASVPPAVFGYDKSTMGSSGHHVFLLKRSRSLYFFVQDSAYFALPQVHVVPGHIAWPRFLHRHDFLDAPRPRRHHHDPVGELDTLLTGMRHEDDGLAILAPNPE